MADQPPRTRRWFSFSLRAFLVGVCLIAIVLMFLAHRWHRYQHQKATIESLLSPELQLEYYPGSRLPGWKYLFTNKQLADDVRHIVTWTNPGKPVDLNFVRMFRRLEQMHVIGGTISDTTPLADLTQLKELYLAEASVTDLTPLVGLTQLKALNLRDTSVTDTTPLAGLTELKHLDLAGTNVTDLSPLAGLTKLNLLDLAWTNVTNLSPLAGLTELTHLNLAGTNVTDLTPLAGLTELKHLNLAGANVTNLTPLGELGNVNIHLHDHHKITIPVELQGRVKIGGYPLPYIRAR